MFDQLVKRSNAVWIYTTGRFVEERRAFLCHLSGGGRSLLTLRNINKLLLVIAERVNIRQRTPISERQIVRAANDWVDTSCTPTSTTETRDLQRKRFIFVAKRWFRFLGKLRDPIRNPQFKPELDSFLKGLRERKRVCRPNHHDRRISAEPFLRVAGEQGLSLKDVSPGTVAAYFVQNKASSWKKSTIKAYGQSLRAFFRHASRCGWCAPGLAETIKGPKIYSTASLPEGPSWEQVQRLIANLNTDRPTHVRDRAIVLLLAVYGLRIATCNPGGGHRRNKKRWRDDPSQMEFLRRL